MNKFLLDTNIYIDYYNSNKFADTLDKSKAPGKVYVSAVVIMELYSGAFTKSEIKIVDDLAQTARITNKLVLPPGPDYFEAGKLLARLQRQKGYEIKKTLGLTNDVLNFYHHIFLNLCKPVSSKCGKTDYCRRRRKCGSNCGVESVMIWKSSCGPDVQRRRWKRCVKS